MRSSPLARNEVTWTPSTIVSDTSVSIRGSACGDDPRRDPRRGGSCASQNDSSESNCAAVLSAESSACHERIESVRPGSAITAPDRRALSSAPMSSAIIRQETASQTAGWIGEKRRLKRADRMAQLCLRSRELKHSGLNAINRKNVQFIGTETETRTQRVVMANYRPACLDQVTEVYVT